MTIAGHIISLALKQDGIFTRQDILKGLYCKGNNMSSSSLSVLLDRMMADGQIVRIERGTYRLNEKARKEFFCKPDNFMLSLNRYIKEKFPFIDYCLWRPSAFAPFMRHVPSVKTTLVDVERVAMESVFMALQSIGLTVPLMLNPSKEECDRYLSNNEMVIVRPLIKEAPLTITDGCPTPTLEKMLIDAVGDRELQHLHGNELFTIYSNAFSDYVVKRTRLLRYASRRNRKDTVLQILHTIQK